MEQFGFDFTSGPIPIVGGGPEPSQRKQPAAAAERADRVGVSTTIAREPPRTLADVLMVVTEAADLTFSRRRDLTSALRSIARMSRRSLPGLPADPRALRAILEGIHPAAFEISAKRYANICSDMRRALDLATGLKRSGPANDALSDQWRVMRELCPTGWIEVELLGFMRWCSGQAISPATVDDATLAAFIAHRDRHDLKLDIPKPRRQVTRAWNQCVASVPEWPRQQLNHVPARTRWTLPWSEFPVEFQKDVNRWADRLAGADLLDEDAPDKPLRPISIKQSRYWVQMAASVLVTTGVCVDELRSLHDLVAPERMAVILNGLRNRYGRQSQIPYCVGTTLRAAAEYYCKTQDKQVERLRRMCKRVAVQKRGMSQKNKDRLLPFRDAATRDRFLLLPSELMRSAERDGRNKRQSAVLAQMAVGLEIAQMAPMRSRNLARLELGRHLTFVGLGRREYAVISIPEEETKNEIALEYPLSPESTRLIRHFIEHHLPELSRGETRFMFPGGKGRAKLPSTLSEQIKHTIRRSIGHRVNLHLLRHFAAMIYLQAYPGAYEAVRRLLGHATASAALDMYVGFETADAVRHFDEVILRQRELATTQAKARLGWGGRR